MRDTTHKRRCRVCERRTMSDQEMPPEDRVMEVVSPSLVVHLTDMSGYTFCGKNCAPWESGLSR